MLCTYHKATLDGFSCSIGEQPFCGNDSGQQSVPALASWRHLCGTRYLFFLLLRDIQSVFPRCTRVLDTFSSHLKLIFWMITVLYSFHSDLLHFVRPRVRIKISLHYKGRSSDMLVASHAMQIGSIFSYLGFKTLPCSLQFWIPTRLLSTVYLR